MGIKYQDTSREAWAAFLPHSGTIDALIVGSLRDGPKTCFDIEDDIDQPHQTVSGNLRHLVERGLVEDSGARGVSPRGRTVIVWRLTKLAQNTFAKKES
jgi:predicted ArsR family transcriptional regulator